MDIFREVENSADRIGRALLLVVTYSLSLSLIFRMEKLQRFALQKAKNSLSHFSNLRDGLTRIATIAFGLFSLLLAFGVALIFVSLGSYALTLEMGITLGGTVAIIAATVTARVVVGGKPNDYSMLIGVIGASAVSLTLNTYGSPNLERTYQLLFLFLLIPLLNAIADTLSVAITRKFLGHLNTVPGMRPGLGRILAHLALDLLLALGCLVLLLFSLRFALDLWG